MRTQSVQTIQECLVRLCEPRWRVLIAQRGRRASAGAGDEPEHTPYWRTQASHCARLRTACPERHTVAPAVYKVKPLFRTRAKGPILCTVRRPTEYASGRLVCAVGASGPAPAARSKAPQIKGTAARSASVIIIMQALRGARDSGERATRDARAPRRLPPSPRRPCATLHLSTASTPNKTTALGSCRRTERLLLYRLTIHMVFKAQSCSYILYTF
ncbi:unnamed protein product [Arctia plantaginis]|nr:unnamed protein product [Arctia plantaginis]